MHFQPVFAYAVHAMNAWLSYLESYLRTVMNNLDSGPVAIVVIGVVVTLLLITPKKRSR